MKKRYFWKWTILFCQAFTAAVLLFAFCLEDRALNERRGHVKDTSDFMNKFEAKFREARAASDAALELTLVDGFVSHMQRIDQSVFAAETEYHKLNLAIYVGLVCINVLALVALWKGVSERQPMA